MGTYYYELKNYKEFEDVHEGGRMLLSHKLLVGKNTATKKGFLASNEFLDEYRIKTQRDLKKCLEQPHIFINEYGASVDPDTMLEIMLTEKDFPDNNVNEISDTLKGLYLAELN